MSWVVVQWVMENSPARGADRLVLLVLAEHAKDSGRDAYPSITRIAKFAAMDKRTAQRSIKALVDAGAISVKENGGQCGTHRYRVIMSRGRRDTTPPGVTPPATDHGGETPPVASDPDGGGETPPEPSLNHLSVVTSDGDRNETLPASTAPTQRQRCKRHRNGNPTDQNCRECRADRIADELAVAEDKREAEQRKANCRDCHGTGWKEHPNSGLPAGKCTTHLWRTA